jgi:hypothetical protein
VELVNVDAIYLNELLAKLIKINQTYYPNPKKKDGDIGERFVKDCVKYYMWRKGFKLRHSGNRTFKIEGQYRAGRGGMGGIDFRFGFEYNNRPFDCYVETKNWGVYSISPTDFQTEILNRFTRNANQPGCIWVLTINRGQITQILRFCQQFNVHIDIVPIDRKITSSQLNIRSLKPIVEHFLDDFDKFMTGLTRVHLHKPKQQLQRGFKPYDDAIILGLPSDLIAKIHHTTPKNIDKRRSELHSQGVNVLDMRSRTSRLARLITQNQLDTTYIMSIIIEMLKDKYRD